MKRLTLFVALIMIICAISNTVTAASEDAAGLILSVKERVEIPLECTVFSSDQYLHDGKTIYTFQWTTPQDASKYANLHIRVSDDGIIQNVNMYQETETRDRIGKVIPKITEQEAIENARAVIKRLNPSIAAEYAGDATCTLQMDTYYVQIARRVQNVPIYNDSANISMHCLTGKMKDFSLSHHTGIAFPSIEGTMEADMAKTAYQDNGYLYKQYVAFGDDKEAKIVYTPKDEDRFMDAVSGKPFHPGENDDIREYAAGKNAGSTEADTALTPAEKKVVDEMQGLKTYEEAVAILQSMPELYLPDGVKLAEGSIYQLADEAYQLHIFLQAKNEEKYSYVHASMDAKTGELIAFYGYSDRKEDTNLTDEEAKDVFAQFADKYLTAYKAEMDAPERTDARTHGSASMRADRVVNGIPVRGNMITMQIDSKTKKIISYNRNWDKSMTFAATENIMPEADIYHAFFSAVALQRCYYIQEKTATCVYNISRKNISYVDGKSGALLSANGKPYEEQEKKVYTDIQGHYAEEAILALASVGVYMDGDSFLPDSIITQKEFVTLVSAAVMEYVPYRDGKIDEERIYENAEEAGILPTEDKTPDAPLTRELAVSYLLRAMGYKNFAEIPGIFRTDFTDAEAIDPALFGYVAIAKGLGIVKGDGTGCFAPKREITRGEAAVTIYNYLK